MSKHYVNVPHVNILISYRICPGSQNNHIKNKVDWFWGCILYRYTPVTTPLSLSACYRLLFSGKQNFPLPKSLTLRYHRYEWTAYDCLHIFFLKWNERYWICTRLVIVKKQKKRNKASRNIIWTSITNYALLNFMHIYMIGRIGIIICNAYTTIWPIVVSPGEWFYKSDFVFRSFPFDNTSVILHEVCWLLCKRRQCYSS